MTNVERTITVKGNGRVSAKPDMIVLPISLSASDTDYEKVMEKGGEQLEGVRNALLPLGFSKEDIKTASFNVSPRYENKRDLSGGYKQIFVGYECAQSLKLEFDMDSKLLADVFSALASSEVNPEFNVRFTVRDKDGVNREMLKNAAENAKEKAEVLCLASGVKLGKLLSIDYNWGEIGFYSDTSISMAADGAALMKASRNIDISPDDINESDTATFVWSIEE